LNNFSPKPHKGSVGTHQVNPIKIRKQRRKEFIEKLRGKQHA